MRHCRDLMRRRPYIFAILLVLGYGSGQVLAQFVPGHVFVSVRYSEGCFNAEFEGILEFDPDTGEANVFADPDDGLCFPSGLTFTPLGDRLLVSNFGLYFEDLGWVQSFGPDGTNVTVLDGTDGLANPSGYNNIAYDSQGNLYVVTGDNWYIMRFTPEGTSEVFADADDGVVFQGSIAAAPNGDVFFCSHRTGEVIRITPDGVGTLFDVPPPTPFSIAVDRRGNLYVGAAGSQIYFYGGAVSANREVLASGYALRAMVVAPDQSRLYVAASHSKGPTLMGLYAIDLSDGSTQLLAGSSDGIPSGIAVHVDYRADIDGDRDIDVHDFATLANLRIDLNGDGKEDNADFPNLISTTAPHKLT